MRGQKLVDINEETDRWYSFIDEGEEKRNRRREEQNRRGDRSGRRKGRWGMEWMIDEEESII